MKHSLLLCFMAIIICHTTTKATIVYTNLDPDSTTTLKSGQTQQNLCGIDLDRDGIQEFDIYWTDDSQTDGSWSLRLVSKRPDAKAIVSEFAAGDGITPITIMSLDASIASGAIFSSANKTIGCKSATNFLNQGDKYIGVCFNISGATHYGWILVSLSSDKTLAIKEYAYEDVAGTAIKAGDKGTATSITSVKKEIGISYNTESCLVSLGNIDSISEVTVCNQVGQVVYKSTSTNNIDLSSYPKGLYIVVAKTIDGKNLSKKIIK